VKTRPVEAVVLVLAAVICAIAPFPAETVEGLYSARLYLDIQSFLTTASNQFPFALLDVAAGCLLVAAWMMVRSRVRLVGVRRAIIWNSVTAVKTAAVVYLLFLALWGLNYRRVPLEQKLDYDRSRLTRDAAISFANVAVAALNGGYAAAHAKPTDLQALDASFADVQGALGATRLAVTGLPKRSLLTFYFRRAAIDGMTDPWFLEIIVNPDVLEFERPFVIAHEWGHLVRFRERIGPPSKRSTRDRSRICAPYRRATSARHQSCVRPRAVCMTSTSKPTVWRKGLRATTRSSG
jgi:hypothetical protein